MPDYQKGQIYTIRYRLDDTLLYVGSTTQPLHKRWAEHKRKYNNPSSFNYNTFLSQIMRDTNDFQNWYIELYKAFPCNSKRELEREEGNIIRLLHSNLNQVIAGRNYEEWREDNKERLKEYYQQWYKENKEERSIKSKEYRENNKEKLKEYEKLRYIRRQQDENYKQYKSEYAKNYNQINKEIVSEKKKVYRENNKEKINERMECLCGCNIRKYDFNRHCKTNKHINSMSLKSQ
jgi:hypothetical protein